MEIAGTVCRHINKHMSCNPAHSDHTACMLDRIIRVYKLRTNSANFRTLAHTQHFFHPVRINGFYIIIQKQQVFSPCMGSTKIINRRIIKFLPPSQKADPWIRWEFFVIFEDFFSSAVILNDNNLKIPVGSILLQHFQTGLKSFLLIFVWNDHRN